jgi:hypothetical protein
MQEMGGTAALPRALSSASHHGVRAMHKEHGRTVESPVEARAGFLDRPVLIVLLTSLALVCILFALVYIGYFAT